MRRHKRRNSIKHIQEHMPTVCINQAHLKSKGSSPKKSLTYLRLLSLLHGDESSRRVAGQSLFAVADESQTRVNRHHLLTVPAGNSTVFRSASCPLIKWNTLIVVGDVTTINCYFQNSTTAHLYHMHCIAMEKVRSIKWVADVFFHSLPLIP